jgi:hypothetical protein
MIEFIGIACFSLGVAILYATWRVWVDRPRGSGISAEMAEFLRTPFYVHYAKALARIDGFPESDWPRFQHKAIAAIIYRGR